MAPCSASAGRWLCCETPDPPPSATGNEMRSAYRRRALLTDAEKGGSSDALRSAVSAFETLTDAGCRAAYHGEGSHDRVTLKDGSYEWRIQVKFEDPT